MKKRMVSQDDLENFLEKLEKLQKINDIEVLKTQLLKASNFYKTYILTKDKYYRNTLLNAIYEMSQLRNNKYIDTEEYFRLYKEAKMYNLSVEEIEKRYENIDIIKGGK